MSDDKFTKSTYEVIKMSVLCSQLASADLKWPQKSAIAGLTNDKQYVWYDLHEVKAYGITESSELTAQVITQQKCD